MAKNISINTSTLGTDIQSMQSTLNKINSSLDKMYEAVRVLDTMWDGPANESFNQQFVQDKADMMEVCETVQKVIEDMRFAKSEYEKCENAVSNIVASIRI